MTNYANRMTEKQFEINPLIGEILFNVSLITLTNAWLITALVET